MRQIRAKKRTRRRSSPSTGSHAAWERQDRRRAHRGRGFVSVDSHCSSGCFGLGDYCKIAEISFRFSVYVDQSSSGAYCYPQYLDTTLPLAVLKPNPMLDSTFFHTSNPQQKGPL